MGQKSATRLAWTRKLLCSLGHEPAQVAFQGLAHVSNLHVISAVQRITIYFFIFNNVTRTLKVPQYENQNVHIN